MEPARYAADSRSDKTAQRSLQIAMQPKRRKIKSSKNQSRTMMARWRDAKLLYKIFAWGCGALILLSGAAIAWDRLGARRAVPALIGYVDDTVDDKATILNNQFQATVKPIIQAQSKFENFLQDDQISRAEAQLNNLQDQLTKWLAELPKTRDSNTRALIQAQIDSLQKQIPVLEKKILDLRKAAAK